MKKTGILILGVLILLAFMTSVSAKVKVLDVVHLSDDSMVTGVIVEIAPNKSIKVETIDGKVITCFSDKMTQVEVKLKSRTVATALAVVGPFFPLRVPIIQGYGQIYNGQYLKGGGFLISGLIALTLLVQAEDNQDIRDKLGLAILSLGYIWSIVDANLSVKKINATRLREYQPKDISTSLNYIRHQGLIVSYNFRF